MRQAVYSICQVAFYGMIIFVCIMFIGDPDIHDKILEMMSKCSSASTL